MDCNLGSEIGQKMRSAVKAKLLELGTGGSAGFIDDELPDYVMVMVANKRTKQQMNAELNLFLGDQTDLFVTWLHEVLQKLQEVTLPASASSKKRKSRQAELPKAKDKDKDKKSRDKKDKRTHRKSGDSDQFNSSADQPMPAISSITDVFAEELLEKAKKTLDVEDELVIKKKKRKITDDEEQQHPTTQETTTAECDVPNTSEISSTTVTSGNREKDIAELAEIQRKIYAAKLHLRQIGELDDESDEEEHDNQQLADDVLNVTEPVETSVKDTTSVSAAPVAPAETNSSSSTRKAKSPIVFNRTSEPTAAKDKPKPQPEPEVQLPKVSDERSERRSVHERLGSKPSQPTAAAAASAPQQQQPAATTAERGSQRSQREMELYVPAHRRRNDQQQQEESKKVERGRERSQRNDIQPSRRRDRESLRGRRSPSRSRSPEANYKHRIGSRVIVAVNKAPEPSDDEDILEKPVNSVIKIKPRPTVSPRRQACKNLLLRAVADAQRSTILAKPTATTTANAVSSKSRGSGDEPEVISSTVGKRRVNRTLDNAAGKELFRRSRREMVINVLHRENKRMRPTLEPQTELKLVHKDLEDELEEEYVPSLSAGEYEEYVPQIVENIDMGMDIDIDMHVEKSGSNLGVNPPVQSKTQFVVTLNGDHALSKASVAAAAAAASYRKRSRKRTPSPLVSSTSSTNVQLLNASVEPTSTTCASNSTNSNSRDSRDRRSSNNRSKRARSSSRSSPSTSCNTPPQRPSRSLHRSEVLRQTQEIKKIIIKNDADDDEEEEHQHASPRKRSQKKRLSSSINVAASSSTSNEPKANSKPQPEESTRSTTPPLPPKRPEKRDQSNDRSTSTQAVASVITASVASTAAAAEAPAKVKHTPIRFKLKPEEEQQAQKSRRSVSKERDSSMERRRISIRNAEDRKYDNLPALSAVSVDSAVLKVAKPKERCKYHPNCSKTFCEYYHPTAPCKSFPNCKFADKCMYSHPKCKFDLACISIDCNFAHSGARDLSHVQLAAPPLSSHVIPVQNYKSISAPSTATTGTTMCKYYPNCTKVGCTFYHPKPCRYGKNCINKLECIFYHPEMQSKFKWVASLG